MPISFGDPIDTPGGNRLPNLPSEEVFDPRKVRPRGAGGTITTGQTPGQEIPRPGGLPNIMSTPPGWGPPSAWPIPEGYYQAPHEDRPALHLNVAPHKDKKPLKDYSPGEAAGMVSHFESAGNPYAGYGGADLSKAPLDETGFPIWNGNKGPRGISHAAGLYQFEPGTWHKYATELGIKDFSPESQRKVFDAAFKAEGFSPWANYNPQLAAAIGMKWVPTSESIASEQNRSNVDVRHMAPEDYLSLLPKIENDDSTSLKRANLMQSLDRGEGIQAIPSLEVSPSGNSLNVVDYDGRNRAQAAIDEGIPSIPVAIRGADPNAIYDKIVGTNKKALDYKFPQVPKPPPLDAASIARNIVPGAFATGGPGREAEAMQARMAAAPQPPTGPQPTVFDQPPQQPIPTAPAPTATGKPDFYPEIVAGINKDIINPSAQAYRGVNVPSPADNVTAGQRIAGANNLAAGNVGLPSPSAAAPNQNSFLSLLSSLNPISSAQAAEPQFGTPVTAPPTTQPGPSSGINFGSPVDVPTPPQPPSFWQNVAQGAMNAPSMGGFSLNELAPFANVASYPIRAPIADVASAGGQLGRWVGGGPKPSMADWEQGRNALLGATQIPTGPIGQSIENALSAPGRWIGSAAADLENEMGLSQPTRNAIRYITELGTDIGLPIAGAMAPELTANALALPARAATAPIRGLYNRLAPFANDPIAGRINRAYSDEMSVSNPMRDETSRETLERSQAVGSPMTLLDIGKHVGPINQLAVQALNKASPEHIMEFVHELEGRMEGIRPDGVSPPVPYRGALSRREAAIDTLGNRDLIESKFGTSNVPEIEDNLRETARAAEKTIIDKTARVNKEFSNRSATINNELTKNQANLDIIKRQIAENKAKIKEPWGKAIPLTKEDEIAYAARKKSLERHGEYLDKRRGEIEKDLRDANSRLSSLPKEIEARLKTETGALTNDLESALRAQQALQAGQRAFSQNPHVVRRQINALPIELDKELYRRGAAYTEAQSMKSGEGRIGKVSDTPNKRELFEALYPTQGEAQAAMRQLDNEAEMIRRSVAFIDQAKRKLGLPLENMPGRDIGYDLAQIAVHLGHSWWSWPYWAIRAIYSPTARQALGGSFMRQGTANSLLREFSNPNISLSPDVNQLMTPRSSMPTNNLRNIGAGVDYMTTVPSQQPQSRLSSDWTPIQ